MGVGMMIMGIVEIGRAGWVDGWIGDGVVGFAMGWMDWR